jgi:anti-sigma factor RsiW
MHGGSKPMNCETGRMLAENDDPALAEHVQSCLSCAISANASYYETPKGLEEKIRRSLRRETTASPNWRMWAVAAAALLVASLGGNMLLLTSRPDPWQMTANNILSAHVRSLAGTHLLDVPSSDQHTVKPWFNGKLDFSPYVPTVDGFPLLGGRLEYFDGRPAAALIYGRNKHIINLFTWPSAKQVPETIRTRNGFHMESWSSNGMTFWAVSDLNEGELREFISLYRNRP